MQRKLTALVIGISNYPNGGELKNPINDADDVSDELERLGFSVVKATDAKSEDIDRALSSFKDALNSNDVGLFYFAGHGMQIKGENYLNTIDTSFIDEVSAKHSSFPLNQVIDTMDSCSNSTNIIILDACRNNPFSRAWNRGPEQSGLASVYTPRGTLIAFATSPGEVAKDGTGRNGTYTESILKHINTQDVPIEELFKRVRNTLFTITAGEQTSWEHTSLAGDFFFNISLGLSVEIYSPESVADSLYLLTPNNVIDDAIKDLYSSNWYKQNPAVDRLSLAIINSGNDDSLFVLGRNIYQAACGGANSAFAFINDFRTKMNGVSQDKSKCILDGMLFEIFFDSKGEIRSSYKNSVFNTVFNLKAFPEYSGSFEFISETLIRYQNKFYVIPGKNQNISVDIISTKNEDDEHLITGIHFEGFNILRKNDAIGTRGSYPIKLAKLKDLLSEEMVIPEGQLTTTFSFSNDDKLLLPYGMSVEK
jgi:hypothetical protein